MHEASLVQALLTRVTELLATEGSCRVRTIHLSVGEFAGVEPTLLRLAFEDAVVHTPLQDARLVITSMPLEATCQACQTTFRVAHFHFECPACGRRDVKTVRGQELLLERVEVEADP